jgi:ribonuclease HII
MSGADRLQSLLEYEDGFWSRGLFRVAGVDEAGRGPLAGPVVAAAVILPRGLAVEGARDSKLLPRRRREDLANRIVREAVSFGIGAASVREIERLNILVATRVAMARALGHLREVPDHVVVDGLPVRGLEWDHDAVVGGDGRVHSIACASILAKVCRDRLMVRLARRYPGYGWETNMGYGTAEHLSALKRLGSTPHHRHTFRGVQMELGL